MLKLFCQKNGDDMKIVCYTVRHRDVSFRCLICGKRLSYESRVGTSFPMVDVRTARSKVLKQKEQSTI